MSSNDKIKELLEPLFKSVTNDINNSITAQVSELAIKLDTLIDRIDMIEKLTSEKKKAPRATKATGAKAVEGEGAETAEGEVAECLNMPSWFKLEFKNNEEFRKRYVDENLKSLINGNATIQSKKNSAQKLTAESQFIWTYIKSSDPVKLEMLETEYKTYVESTKKTGPIETEEHSDTETTDVTEAKPVAKPEAKAKPKAKAAAKPEAKAEAKPEAKPEAKAAPKKRAVAAKPEAKPEAK